MVFTTLTRHAMPLIRYRTGDKARILAEPCVCGSVVKRMDKIAGRMQQLHALYSMPVLDEILFQLSQIIDYQACFDDKNRQLCLTLLLSDDTETIEEAVNSLLKSVLQDGHTIAVHCELLNDANRYSAKSLYAAKRNVMVEE